GPPEAAVQCAQLACDVLNTKGPIVRGIELMKRLLERVDLGRSQRRTILILLGRGLRNAGRMDDARRCLSEAHALGDEQGQVRAATAAGNPATVAVAVAEALASGVVAADEHRYEDARMIYRRALMGAQGLGDGVSQAKAYAGLSMLPPLAGRMDRTQEHFQMAVELARAHADEQLALKTIGNYGLALFRREQLDEALACFAEAEAGHRRSENHHAVAAFSMNQGILLQRLGRLAASDQAFDRALEACEAGGDLRIRASVLGAKASLALKRGQYARAFRLANEALEWQWSNGDRSMARRTQRLLAGICIDTGQLVRAQQYLDALVPKSGEVREPAERLSTDINRAVLMLCSDQSDVAACRLLEAVVEEAEELELTPVVVLAMVNLGEGLEQMGLHSRAEASFASALSMSRETFPALSGIAMAALAVVAARAGNAKRARSLLRESSELVGNWTFERLRWQLRAGVVALLVGEDIEALECLHKVRREMRSLGLGAQTSLRHLFVFLEASLRERRSELSVTIERTSMDASAQQSAVLAALAELALLEQEAGQFETSERLLDRTEQMARELQHGGFLARIAHQRLDIARERGRYDEARVHGAVALEHARTAADHPLEARIRIDLGLVDQECGDLEQAAVHLNAAEQLAESLNDDRAAALVLCSRATLEFSREEYARAEEGFGRAQSRFEEIGLDRHAMLCEGHRADALMRLNRLEFAGDLLEKTVEGARLHAHEHAEYAFLGSLAELRARQGRFDQATWHVEQALRLTCTVPVEQALFFGKTAIVALLCGDENQAREREAEAVRVAQAAGLPAGSAIWQVLRIVGELREQRQPHKG
ncbi:MAG: hypothetical protein CL927_18130, partial [Deltaproteobacteria bacterium]|nr:hypothetical protein [Deltaproteobacteria bacterium]HCH61228.1 hypothetical protein [Deltaproteobacteria bacterium]